MDADLLNLVGSIGVPGMLCVMLLKQYASLQKSLDNNTKALYLLAGKIGVKVTEGDTADVQK